MSLVLISASTDTPVSLCGFKEHISFSGTGKDDSLDLLLHAAVNEAELYTGRQLMPAIYELQLPEFQSTVYLAPVPVTGINSVTYFDGTNDVTMASGTDYVADIHAEPAEIYFLNSPAVAPDRPDAVKINFGAGYPTAEAVPYAIKAAILLAAGGMYVNPTDAVRNLPTASKNLLRNFRIYNDK